MSEAMPLKPREGIKSWRLVVRNLPFNTKSGELQDSFKKYGEIKEINLPKCRDKRFPDSCAGFCFVQFAKRKSAEYALRGIPDAAFKGRTLSVAWSFDKDTFVTKKVLEGDERQQIENKLKSILLRENGKRSKVDKNVKSSNHFTSKGMKKKPVEENVKTEVVSDEEEDNERSDSDMYLTANEEEEQNGSMLSMCKTEDSQMDVDDAQTSATFDDDEEDDQLNTGSEDTDECSDEDDEDSLANDKKKKKKNLSTASTNKLRQDDEAVLEGRVIFIRNVDFGATVETIREVAGAFGDVTLAVRCVYPGTDQPTGTAFVHFRQKDAADAFLNQLLKSDGVYINGRQIFGHRAVPRASAAEFAHNTKKEPKDKRNLHLLRVSLIRAGTAQARNMSEADVELRKRLIVVAKNKLKDLTMFVSPTRLAVHNIPFSLSDEKFRALCLASAKRQGAKVMECRIMRESLGRDERGRARLGRSKGFGFVAFAEHADALSCIRNLNNDPDAFTDERRPIVEFSVENLNAIRAKERRTQDFQQRQQQKPETATSGRKFGALQSKNRVNKFAPFNSLNDPATLAETKRELMSGGQKWLPKRLGQKVRHRDLADKQAKDSKLNKERQESNKRIGKFKTSAKLNQGNKAKKFRMKK